MNNKQIRYSLLVTALLFTACGDSGNSGGETKIDINNSKDTGWSNN